MFAELWKASIGFVVSAQMEQQRFRWTNLTEI
jgi:hypothetical protein